MSYRLFIAEKPSVAKDIAQVLGNPKRGSSSIDTDGGVVTWCIGHLLEQQEPEAYGPQYGNPWRFDVLPIVPNEFLIRPNPDTKDQLKAIGALLTNAGEVVIATDIGREGEMIGREVLEFHKFRGKISRLWLNSQDAESIKKALGNLRPSAETEPNYHAALARSRADWLVGMNMTRAITKKNAGGVFSIGRVQTPTTALVVRRDREIENFKSREYYEIKATTGTADGKSVVLTHAPKDEDRIFDRDGARAIVEAISGLPTTLSRVIEDKRKSAPKLFDLSRFQKRANALWGWSAKKALDIAQALYEKHKATTYPRVDCEYLSEEMIADIPRITGNLVALPQFAHLAGKGFSPRKSVFNTAKLAEYEHHAIIPTCIAPPLDAMEADEEKAYLLIATHYLASLLPDYEYKSTRIFTTLQKREFSVSGITPGNPGWKIAFADDAGDGLDDENEKVATLPDIPDGTGATVTSAEIETKKTKPPARYTEGSLLADMENVAKFVTDPAQKARLKETSGLGTPATRADVIETIKIRAYVEAKGNQLISTSKARELIATLETDLPALADPGETAVWEDGLDAIAKRQGTTDTFVGRVVSRIREYLDVLAKKPDPAAAGPEGKPTGLDLDGVPVLDHGEFYTARVAFPGRIYKDIWGHLITAEELVRMVRDKETLEVADMKKRDGSPLSGSRKVRYNPEKKPFPAVEVVSDAQPAVSTEVSSPRKGKAAIQDHGEFYTCPGFESSGRPVRFYKKIAGREITAQELSDILASGKDGHKLTGFVSAKTGKPFDALLVYNARKKPYAGIEFKFD